MPCLVQDSYQSLVLDSSVSSFCKGYIQELHDREQIVRSFWHCPSTNHLRVLYMMVEISNVYSWTCRGRSPITASPEMPATHRLCRQFEAAWRTDCVDSSRRPDAQIVSTVETMLETDAASVQHFRAHKNCWEWLSQIASTESDLQVERNNMVTHTKCYKVIFFSCKQTQLSRDWSTRVLDCSLKGRWNPLL